jgi:CheY-like chemotaxis protein
VNRTAPIVVIEDDIDDRYLIGTAIDELGLLNELIFFQDAIQALAFLKGAVDPFFILSDINMPKLNGIDLLAQIQADDALAARCIPFIFLSTHAGKQAVTAAYEKGAHGFFVKPLVYDDLKETLRVIANYCLFLSGPGSQ